MKKLKSNAITGLLIASGVVTAGVCTMAINNNAIESKDLHMQNDVMAVKKANVLEEAQNQVNEANAKADEANQELEKAMNIVNEATTEAQNAADAIKKAEDAKVKAVAQVAAAKTEEERKIAEEKVKAVEAEIERAIESKKAADAKVQAAEENVKKAETVQKEALENVQKALDNKKLVEEQVEKETTTNTKTVEKEENVQTSVKEEKVNEDVKKTEVKTEEKKVETKKTEEPVYDEGPRLTKEALEAAARSEKAAQDALNQYLQEQKEAGDKAKAERAEQERLVQEQAEKEAEERRQRESTESLKSWGSANEQAVFGDREFTFAQKNVDVSFDPNTKENPKEIKCTGDHCGSQESGWIWFARFKSNFKIFREPGTNNYVNDVLIGRRGSVTSWIQYAPSIVDGHEFVRWDVTDAVEEGMKIKVYTAVYK